MNPPWTRCWLYSGNGPDGLSLRFRRQVDVIVVFRGFHVVSTGASSPASYAPSVQILDYTIQMHRLLPLLAAAFGFHFTGQSLMQRLRRLEREHVHGGEDAPQPAAVL